MSTAVQSGHSSTVQIPEELMISADSHVSEPVDLWEQRLPFALRDRAPNFRKSQARGGKPPIHLKDQVDEKQKIEESKPIIHAERKAGKDPVARLDETPGIELAGIWTHLADGMDPERSRVQIERYEAALAAVAATGRALPARHVAATEGVFVETAPAYDLVRVGLGYYGSLGLDIAASPALGALAAELRPAMTVIARPVRLETLPTGATVGYGGEWTATRPSRVATLPIGYADGWTRRYWPGAEALIRGRRVPLIGRVSMDSVCADVTDVPDATIEDEVVLLGAQGDERIRVESLAALRGTVPNEVMCAFGPRLARRARGLDDAVG